MLSDSATWQKLASLLPDRLVVIDVGARAGVNESWSAMAPNVQVYGFEPDMEECARLNETAASFTEYVPVALWSAAGRLPFYVTEDPMCSSIYPPSEELAAERPRLALTRIRERTTIEARTIDDWAHERGIDRFDYVKLDAQGAELAILQGAARLLPRARAVSVEVQFSPQYEGAPSFGEVDGYLREQGFALWRLSELSHCGFAGSGNPKIPEHLDYNDERVHLAGGGGQLLWGDAYYVRADTCRLSSAIAWDDAIRDACAAWVHGYIDLAEVSLRRGISSAPQAAQGVLGTVLEDSPPEVRGVST